MFIPPKHIKHHLLLFLQLQYLFLLYVVLQEFLFHNRIYQILFYCISWMLFHHDNDNLQLDQKLFHNMLKTVNGHLINFDINLFLYIIQHCIIHIKDFDPLQFVQHDTHMFYHQVFLQEKSMHMAHLLQQISRLMQDLIFFVFGLLQLTYLLNPNLCLVTLKSLVDLTTIIHLTQESLDSWFLLHQVNILLEYLVLLY